MFQVVERFVNTMTKEDIMKFAQKNNLTPSAHEVDFIYTFIKKNYKSVLANPKGFELAPYKNEFSSENYQFLETLITKYKRFL